MKAGEQKQRHEEIDLLRGWTILVMILIHTNAFHRNIPLAELTWDLSQFAVPSFIFCAAYIFFRKPFNMTLPGFVSHIWKRIWRLIVPYYLFLLLYFPTMYFAEPRSLTASYMIKTLTLTGGIDLNWLVLLFIQLSFVMPLIALLKQKSPPLLHLYAAIAYGAGVVLLLWRSPLYYKAYMWLPWSVVVLFALLHAQYENRRRYLPIALLLAAYLYPTSRFILLSQGSSLLHFHNKYPPNLFQISYGILCILVFIHLFKIRWLIVPPIRTLFSFLSAYSYSIYFIHFYLLYLTTTFFRFIDFHWITHFLVILIASICVQYGFNRLIPTVRVFLPFSAKAS